MVASIPGEKGQERNAVLQPIPRRGLCVPESDPPDQIIGGRAPMESGGVPATGGHVLQTGDRAMGKVRDTVRLAAAAKHEERRRGERQAGVRRFETQPGRTASDDRQLSQDHAAHIKGDSRLLQADQPVHTMDGTCAIRGNGEQIAPATSSKCSVTAIWTEDDRARHPPPAGRRHGPNPRWPLQARPRSGADAIQARAHRNPMSNQGPPTRPARNAP